MKSKLNNLQQNGSNFGNMQARTGDGTNDENGENGDGSNENENSQNSPKPEKSKLRNPIFPKKFYVGPKKNLEAQFRRFGPRISDPENTKPIRVNLNQPQPTPRFVNRKKNSIVKKSWSHKQG